MLRGSRKKIRKVLILSANPTGTLPLRLDKEIHLIRSKLIQSKQRRLFVIEVAAAFTISDLLRLLEEFKPDIVHFCGHGTGPEGIVCDDDTNGMRLIPTEALANLLKGYSRHVRCVILNACFSEVQAEELRKHIDYVVGMKGEISDDAALAYVDGFYTALFAGSDAPACHELGTAAIQLMSLPEDSTPELKIKPPIKPTNEPIPHSSKKKSYFSKSKATKSKAASDEVPLIADGEPPSQGRREFLRNSMPAFAASMGVWSLRNSQKPKYPLTGFYIQEANTFPKKRAGNSGLKVESFYCEVAISHNSSEYHIIERTFNHLRLVKIDEIIAGYVVEREWNGPMGKDASIVETTSSANQAKRYILDEIQFDQFARDADAKAFEEAKKWLKSTYSDRRASWQWNGSKLVKKCEGEDDQLLSKVGDLSE